MMKKIRTIPYLIPKPVALIGALVEDKPNFFTVADLCTTAYKRFVISSGKSHYTNKGILENEAFSVNIPSNKMVEKTDYCGIKSGKKTDKSNLFDVFYGEILKTVPMIKGAPITHTCKLVDTVDFGDTHYLFIGEVIETFANEVYLKNNIPVLEEINPFTWYSDNYYRNIGEKIAEAYKIGKNIDS
jgi:flavin reductase (DIM6/NTAB) family NADH-FMN oxidoreductase RutF